MEPSRNRNSQGERPDDPEGSREASIFALGATTPLELHICPQCSSRLVYPTDWAPVDMCHWRVELRCPECEWQQVGLFEQTVLDRFDEVLDAATDAMIADLRRLQSSNMEHELERFNEALGRDLILPEDF